MVANNVFPLDGGCDCGVVRYRMVKQPLFVHCCHCRWCQRESGASFALNAMIEADYVIHLGAAVRQLLQQPAPVPEVHADLEEPNTPNRCAPPTFVCRHCGAPMLIIETFARAHTIRAPPSLRSST
jgi:hypothetical protein